MSDSNSHRAWSAVDERKYIQNIGTHSVHTRDEPRKKMLQLYFNAMQRRAKWDDLDRTEIMMMLFNEIRKETTP